MKSSRCPLVACSDVIGSNVTDILMWQRPPKRSGTFRVPIRLILRRGRLLLFCYYRAAIARWPDATIILRQRARVVHDSRRLGDISSGLSIHCGRFQ
jgi:hypothetical protein